jgi:phage recombination protein Bet
MTSIVPTEAPRYTMTGIVPTEAPRYTSEQVEIIKRTVAQGVTDDELALFLETARRRGLDPFAGQIHAVRRYDGRAGRDVMSIQTGIDGYRKLADETGLVEWVEGPEFTGDGREWVGVWLEEAPPAAARFTVKRKDRAREERRVALWREYVQKKGDGTVTKMWATKAATMLGKCAEALALRAAFPERLGGIYTADEMDQATNPAATAEAATVEAVTVERVDDEPLRLRLWDRFGPFYRALSDEDRGELWQIIGDRFYGTGSLRHRFLATPIHVLEDIVGTYCPEGDDGDSQDGSQDKPGDDDGPSPVGSDPKPQPEAPADAESVEEPAGEIVVEAEPEPGEEDPESGERLDGSTEPDPVDLSDVPDPNVDEPAYAAWLGEVASVYGTLGVVDVGHLISRGWVDLDDGRRLVMPGGQTGLTLIDRLERHRSGTFRKTVAAALSAAGFRGPGAVPGPDAEEPARPVEEAPDDGLGQRRALLTRWKRAHRELASVDESAARTALAARVEMGAAEDEIWSTFDLDGLRELVEGIEEVHRQTVPF